MFWQYKKSYSYVTQKFLNFLFGHLPIRFHCVHFDYLTCMNMLITLYTYSNFSYERHNILSYINIFIYLFIYLLVKIFNLRHLTALYVSDYLNNSITITWLDTPVEQYLFTFNYYLNRGATHPPSKDLKKKCLLQNLISLQWNPEV